MNAKVTSVRYPPCGVWMVEKNEFGAYSVIPELEEIRREWIRMGLEKVPIEYSEEDLTILHQLGVKIVGCTQHCGILIVPL